MTRITAFAVPFLASASIAYAAASGGIESLLRPEFSSIPKFIEGALKAMVMVALPIISLFIVYSGFMFVIARGNEGMLSEAKKNFFYVIVGSILILGAWVIATLIGGTAAQLTNT
ncbi:hypothetical protein K8R03_02320 [Candidatus Kaiserbacteria bacterium]|nr:hypothetical protein [Candidatus Kaiserbacteria bacterium]